MGMMTSLARMDGPSRFVFIQKADGVRVNFSDPGIFDE